MAIQFSGCTRKFTPALQRHFLEQLKYWKYSIVTYTAASMILTAWCCEWRLVCDKIPYYRSKYPRGVPRKYSIEPQY